jgi:hypothetical protein
MSPETARLVARAQEVIAAAREVRQWTEANFVSAREQRKRMANAEANALAHTAQDERQDVAGPHPSAPGPRAPWIPGIAGSRQAPRRGGEGRPGC